jgi:predicted hydrocarbon binding protein
MNGVFHRGLKEFVVEEYGQEAWDAAREEAGVEAQVYLPVDTRPDAEFISLVETVPQEVGESPFDLLEEFGRFLAPRLIDTYGGRVVDDGWGPLDLIASLESRVHDPLRSHNAELNPPRVDCRRETDDRAVVVYESPRRLCPIARGLLVGVGDHYDETLTVSEERCLHRGDERCELVVERT